MHTQHRYSHRSGFTMVEILVVIAILSVLVGIILNQIILAREAGRRSSCLSNEHQIGLAMLQYVQDYDEHFPSGSQQFLIWDPPPPPVTGEGWAGQIFSYVKNTAVFQCPDDFTHAPTGLFTVSYGYNEWISSSSAVASHLAAIPYSADTVLCFEVSGCAADVTLPDEGASTGLRTYSCSGYGSNLMSGPHGTQSRGIYATGRLVHMSPSMESQEARHRGGSNFLLVDGHTKWLQPDKVLAAQNVPEVEFRQYTAHFLDKSYPSASK